jgi:hypothetical protein
MKVEEGEWVRLCLDRMKVMIRGHRTDVKGSSVKSTRKPGKVAHACIPRYSGSRGRRITT